MTFDKAFNAAQREESNNASQLSKPLISYLNKEHTEQAKLCYSSEMRTSKLSLFKSEWDQHSAVH